jgi:FdhD protein
LKLQKKAIEKLTVTVLSDQGMVKKTDLVVKEYALSIFLNKKKLVTILCTPKDLQELAIGYLFTQGFITIVDDIVSISEERLSRAVHFELNQDYDKPTDAVLPPGGIHEIVSNAEGLSLTNITSDLTVSFHLIIESLGMMEKKCELFGRTGGAHACAISNMHGSFIFSEDIGRHNTIDKVIGKCLLDGMRFDDKVLFTTGRISSAILSKIARAGIPILVSRSAPTWEAIKLAKKYSITLIGFAREGRMNVYTNTDRIVQG